MAKFDDGGGGGGKAVAKKAPSFRAGNYGNAYAKSKPSSSASSYPTTYKSGGRFGAPAPSAKNNKGSAGGSGYPKVKAPVGKVSAPARQGAISRRISNPAPAPKSAPAPRSTATTARTAEPLARTSAPVARTSAPMSTTSTAPELPADYTPPPPFLPEMSEMSEEDKINAYLRGDTTYIGQEAGLRNAMDNFNTNYDTQGQEYDIEYNMNKDNLDKALVEANTGLTDDYASRGMMNSGLYGKAWGDQQDEFKGRQTSMNNARNMFLSDQLAEKNEFDQESLLSGQKARQDAINRRAASLVT